MDEIKRIRGVIAATTVVAVLGVSDASAANVAPGATVPLAGTTTAIETDRVGAVVDGTDLPAPFQLTTSGGTDYIGGVVQQRVITSDNLGTLGFRPRIRDTFTLAGFLEFAVVVGVDYTGFAGFSTDVEFLTDGLGDRGPVSVTRSADGDTLSFDFSPAPNAIFQPLESYFLAILTDASDFDDSGTITIYGKPDFAGAEVNSFTIFGAPAPVPLPAGVWLMLGALGSLIGLHRRS